MNTYTAFLHIHSTLRWVALALAIFVTVKSLMGLSGKSVFGKKDNIFAASFVGTMHLQLLLGLILYFFLSPITESALSDFGGAMKNPELRFWAVEHTTMMVLAVVAAQIGRSKSKKAADSAQKFKLQAIFFGAALLLMLAGIPWNRI
ncbi:hypothetical protein [Marinoscillum sp.]|uniref:hypothetical protein n=1 Tax=Marinoscillum sp. TaxID=2024838 RepID=UPI003BAAFE0A